MPARPVHELRKGMLVARIYRRTTKSSTNHSVSLSRLFRDGELLRESRRLGGKDLALARLLLDEAHVWILLQNEFGLERGN